MSDPQNRIPSFDEVMKKQAPARGVPSFEDVMMEEPPVKKKEEITGLLPMVGNAFQTGSKVPSPTTSKLPSEIEEKNNEPLSFGRKAKESVMSGVFHPDTKIDQNDPAKSILESYDKDIETAKSAVITPHNIMTGAMNINAHKAVTDFTKEKEEVEKSIVTTDKQARNWLFREGKTINPLNKTDMLALQTHMKRQALDMASEQAESFDDIAFNLKGVKKEDSPEAKKGRIVNEALHDPLVIEKASENADFHNKYFQAKHDLYRNYPSFAFKEVGEMIGQKLEDKRMTGWLYANPSLKKVEKAIELLKEDGVWGEQQQEVFDQRFKPAIAVGVADKVIPLTDVAHKFGYGVYEGAKMFDASGRDIINKLSGGFIDPEGNGLFQNLGLMEKNEDRTERLAQEMEATPRVTPTRDVTKILGGASEFTGMFAPMIIGSAVGMPHVLTTTLMFEGHNADHARELFKGDVGKQNLYTLASTSFDVFATKALPTKKAAQGFKNLMDRDIKKVITELSDGKITEQFAPKYLWGKAFKNTKKIVGHNTTTALVLEGYNLGHKGIDAAFGKREFNVENELQEAIENYPVNWINSTFLSGLASVKEGQRPIDGKMYKRIADNADFFRDVIEKDTNLSPIEKKDRLEKIDRLQAVGMQLSSKKLGLTEQEKYLDKDMQQFVAQKSVKESPDKVLAKEEDRTAKIAEIEKEHIVTPMSNTELLENLFDHLPKGSQEKLSVEGKFNESKVGEYLKYIAQQSNGLKEDWTQNEDGRIPRMADIPESVKEVANERWAKEIEAAQPKEEITELTEKDITKAADDAGIKWDNDKDFMAKSKELTGVQHLSEMNQEQLQKMKDYVEAPTAQVASVSENKKDVYDWNKYVDDYLAIDFNEGKNAERDIQKQIDHVNNLKFPMTVYRGINTKSDRFESGNYSDISWTPDKKIAESFGDKVSEKKINDISEIDVEQTIRTRVMNPGENEISVKEPASKQTTNEANTQAKGENLEVSGKGVTLPSDEGKGKNIPSKEDKGTSDSPRISGEESPEKLNERYKRVTNENDFTDPYDRAVNYFAGDGKINPSELERMSEEEMNHWLKLDAENSPEREKFINEKSKNENTKGSNEGAESVKPKDGSESEKLADKTSQSTENQSGEGTGEPPPQKPATESGEGDTGGITHAANEVRRKERGLPEYQKSPTTEEALMNEAEKKLQEGYDVEDLMNRLEKGETPEPVENFIRKIYIATLDAEIAKNPTDALLAKQKRFAVVGDLVNSKLGLNLWSLKGEASPLSSISDFYVSAMEAKGVDKLTEAEKLEVQKDYAEVKAARDKAEKVAQDATAKFEEMKAENELLKQQLAAKNKSKSSKVYTDGKRDFKAEIKNYKDELIAAKEEHLKWLKDSGIHTASIGGNKLMLTPKMAKIILKIAAAHVEQIGVKIAEVAKRTWEDVKDIFDGITENDIRDVFSGKYNEKKLTKSEIFAQMRELKTEANLLNEYENLLKGGEPKEETRKQKRNQRLSDIRKQIDELNKERGTGKYSDEAIAKRAIDANKRKKAEFDRKLKEGEFEKEKQPVSIYDSPQFKKKNTKLYNELLDSQNEAHDSQLRFEKKLVEEETKKWGLGDKLRNIVKKSSGTLKTLFASFDASSIGIQNLPMILTNPVLGVKGVVRSYKGFLKQKAFDRYLAEIHNSPDWPMIKESIRITEPKSLLESGREEFFPNRFKAVVTIKGKQYGWIKVKGNKYELLDISKPFERQFTMLGNILRVTKFRTEATKLYEKGLTWEKNREEFITLGKRINNLTSSPDVPAAYQNEVTRTLIWSTRLLAAKFNMLGISDIAAMIPGTGVTKGYYKGLGIKGQLISRQQFAAVGDLAKFAVGVVTATYIYALARGWSVNTDPDDNGFMDATSPDGTESMNFTGGFSRPISLIFQMAEGGKRKKGVFKKYGGFTDPVKELSRFVAGKAPPLTRTTLNIVAGKDMVGQPADLETEAAKYKMPLAVGQIYKQVDRDGLGDLFKQGFLMYIGINSKDTRDYEKESQFTDEDKKDPTFKMFIDKGVNFPEFNPEKIQTKEVNGKVTEHLSDYPKETQEKYITTKKKYFKEELKNLQTGEYEVYRDNNGTVHIESDNVETGDMKFVPFKSLTPEDIQYLIGSSLSERATKRAKDEGILDKPPLKKQ